MNRPNITMTVLTCALMAASVINAPSATAENRAAFSTVFAKGSPDLHHETLPAFSVNERRSAGINTYANLEMILSEDFAGFTAGTDETPDETDLTAGGNDFVASEYTALPGWWGVGIYQAGGICALQYPNRGGVLTTPNLTLNGRIIVKFRARAVKGNTVLMCGLLYGDPTDPQGAVPTQIVNLQAEDGWSDIELEFENFYKGDDCYLQINGMTYNKGIRIDDLTIERDADYVERPRRVTTDFFHTTGFSAMWNEVDVADSYTVTLKKEVPTGAPAINMTENFDSMDYDNPSFPDGLEVTTIEHPLSQPDDNGDKAIRFTDNNDCIIMHGLGARIKSISFLMKPGAELDPDGSACIMISGRTDENAEWNPIIYGYVADTAPEGEIVSLDEDIEGLYTDIMVGCHYFAEGDVALIDNVTYTTDDPTMLAYAGEYSGITETKIDFKDLDKDTDYYLQVSAVSGDRMSEPSDLHYAFGVAAPSALAASDKSDNAFTANWEKAPKATSYTVDLFTTTKITEEISDNIVLAETFDKIECGATPDNPEAVGNFGYIDLDEYTELEGWKGSGLMIADGMIGCIGNSVYDIVSPFITLGNNNGNYTVEISAYAPEGCILAVEGFKGYATHTFTTDGAETMKLDISNGLMKDRLVIYSVNGRTFLIDDITVRQNATKNDIILSYIKSEETDGDASSIRFNNLEENADSYAYAVTAHRQKYAESTTSVLSNVVCVDSEPVSVIAPSVGDTVRIEGLTATVSTEQGGHLMVFTADGTTVASADIASGVYSFRLPQQGMYIIRLNDKTIKAVAK